MNDTQSPTTPPAEPSKRSIERQRKLEQLRRYASMPLEEMQEEASAIDAVASSLLEGTERAQMIADLDRMAAMSDEEWDKEHAKAESQDAAEQLIGMLLALGGRPPRRRR